MHSSEFRFEPCSGEQTLSGQPTTLSESVSQAPNTPTFIQYVLYIQTLKIFSTGHIAEQADP